MNVPYSSSSQLVLNVIKSNKKTHESLIGDKKDHKNPSELVRIIRQNSSCDICMKCFSEKKKLAAHRRLCEKRYGKKNSPSQQDKKNESLKARKKPNTIEDQNQLTSDMNSNSTNLNFLLK